MVLAHFVISCFAMLEMRRFHDSVIPQTNQPKAAETDAILLPSFISETSPHKDHRWTSGVSAWRAREPGLSLPGALPAQSK